MPWLQVSLTTDIEKAPIVDAVLRNMDALSVTLANAGEETQVEADLGERPLWTRTRLCALFPADCNAAALRLLLEQTFARDTFSDLRMRILEDQPWERAWLDRFHPIRCGSRLWVCAAGQRPPVDAAVIVELDPGLAFGTGHHPTTALCLAWLDAANLLGKTLIDYGCGSGILGIAALRLGAAEAIAVDHDPQAREASRDNARENAVGDRLKIVSPEEVPAMGADCLLANILAEPLVELQPILTSLVRPGGHLVLSGILDAQAKSVASAYRHCWDLEKPQARDGWVLLHGRRRG